MQGEPPSDLARRAQEAGETLVEQGADAAVPADSYLRVRWLSRSAWAMMSLRCWSLDSVEEFGDVTAGPS